MLLTERRVSLREKPETTCAQVLSLLQPGRVGHHGYDDAHWCRTSRYVALVHFWCSGSMVRGPVSPPSQDSTPEMVVRLASHPTACRLPAPRAIRRPPGDGRSGVVSLPRRQGSTPAETPRAARATIRSSPGRTPTGRCGSSDTSTLPCVLGSIPPHGLAASPGQRFPMRECQWPGRGGASRRTPAARDGA
jgi:hypothetical protein